MQVIVLNYEKGEADLIDFPYELTDETIISILAGRYDIDNISWMELPNNEPKLNRLKVNISIDN